MIWSDVMAIADKDGFIFMFERDDGDDRVRVQQKTVIDLSDNEDPLSSPAEVIELSDDEDVDQCNPGSSGEKRTLTQADKPSAAACKGAESSLNMTARRVATDLVTPGSLRWSAGAATSTRPRCPQVCQVAKLKPTTHAFEAIIHPLFQKIMERRFKAYCSPSLLQPICSTPSSATAASLVCPPRPAFPFRVLHRHPLRFPVAVARGQRSQCPCFC